MTLLKCKMCGGALTITEGSTVCECEFCGTLQTVPTADNEKKMNLFARANRLRFNNEFDKASGVYEGIIADFPEEAEAYWGLVLCKYGIEYVDDPATGKKIPTCHRSSFDSIFDDSNYELVMEYADAVSKRVYREEAKQIEELRKGIIEVSANEKPYDIFICYKETDENGERTLDSVLAQDIYDALTEKGYRVFFSRITLEDKLGVEYEPYIFAALHSAKVMLAVGADYEYYDAVWVKNEWSRYLQLIASGEKKTLIPVYKNLDAYDMPKEFARLQAQDMGKVGALQDLLRGIDKIIGKDEKKPELKATVIQSSGPNVASFLDRGNMALEDEDWDSAKKFFDDALNIDSRCAHAYLGLAMTELKIKTKDVLGEFIRDKGIQNRYFDRAQLFADESLKKEIEEWLVSRRKYLEIVENTYAQIVDEIEKAEDYEQFISIKKKLEFIGDYKDASEKRNAVTKKIQEFKEKEEEEARQKELEKAQEEREKAKTEIRNIQSQIDSANYSLSSEEKMELARLEKEAEQIDKELKKAEEQFENSEVFQKAKREESEIHEKEEKLKHLGLFKNQEKKTLQSQIDVLKAENLKNKTVLEDKCKEIDEIRKKAEKLDNKVREYPYLITVKKKISLIEKQKELEKIIIGNIIEKADYNYDLKRYEVAMDLYAEAKRLVPDDPHTILYLALSKGWKSTVIDNQFEMIDQESELSFKLQHQLYGDSKEYFDFCNDGANKIAVLLNAIHQNYINYHDTYMNIKPSNPSNAFLNLRKEAVEYLKFGTKNCCKISANVIMYITRDVHDYKEASEDLLHLLDIIAHNRIIYHNNAHIPVSSYEKDYQNKVSEIRKKALKDMESL